MDEYGLNHTNIIAAYAGYYKNEELLLHSSSGGVATELSEIIINHDGVVYGATYSDDFYSAHYLRVVHTPELSKLKGSKYVFVQKKTLYDGEWKSVYEAVCRDILAGRTVLFVGLGCDVATLKQYCKKRNVVEDYLYTIELLCDGVTNENVHEDYLKEIEKLHNSKVVDFTVRSKKDGWVPIYIYAKFQNEDEHTMPFYNTAYGYAFTFYKKHGCYSCRFKKNNHFADLTIGDFWGCEVGMKEYNRNGVSIIYVQTKKGMRLIEKIDRDRFRLIETDAEYALKHNPRYISSHPVNNQWEQIDDEIKSRGLFGAYRMFSGKYYSKRMKNNENKEIVLWGTGDCFHRLAPCVIERGNVICAVDSNSHKWETNTEYGIACKSPDYISGKDVLVLIMVENAASVCEIANALLDMDIISFDHIENWICYSL